MTKESSDFSFLSSVFRREKTLVETRELVAKKLKNSGAIASAKKDYAQRMGQPFPIVQFERILKQDDCPLPLDPKKIIRLDQFKKHLEVLKKEFTIQSLENLISLLYANKEIPENSLAITIDGGHIDAFLNAFPLLAKQEIPATFCINSAYINSEAYHIEDRIRLLLMLFVQEEKKLPKLEIFKRPELSEKEVLYQAELNEALVHSLMQHIAMIRAEEKLTLIDQLLRAIGPAFSLPDYYDFFTWEDARIISSYNLGFASMGHSHTASPLLNREELLYDVLRCAKVCEEHEINLESYFCFTDGAFNSEALETLVEIGYEFALSLGKLPEKLGKDSPIRLLSRATANQFDASNPEVLLCRILGMQSDDVEF